MSQFHSGPNAPILDGFTLRRIGDSPVNLKITLDLRHYPEVFRLAPPLAHVLGVKEETRAGVVHALWSYIKLNQLQDKLDRRMIRADDALRPVRGTFILRTSQCAEVTIRRYLARRRYLLQFLGR
jgi:SWI/SNF-related matrix-associated actin-dependent regulator of chromatin subfamily D